MDAEDKDEDPDETVQNMAFYFGRKDCETDKDAEPGDVSMAQKADPKTFPNAKASFQAAFEWFVNRLCIF